MKGYIALFMISILFASAVLMEFQRVGAVPNITLSPTSGPPGSSVTVTGTGFVPNASSIAILFDNKLVTEVSADQSGTFAETITIPTTAREGSHTIAANDGVTSYSKSFTVTSAESLITLSPSSGKTGTTVTVSGSNFLDSKTITIKFDNNNITTSPSSVTSSNTGTFSATIIIPSTAAIGSHTISATDGTSTASATFNVSESDITLSPTSGAAGTVVTISGASFAANTAITVRLDNDIITTNPVTVMSADDGSFSFTINVPTTLSVGSHTISASDGSKTELATFTVVTTAITLSPTSGIAGSTINVTGTGFIASASLTIKFDTLALTTTPSNLVASSSGSFSATITVPNTASSGVHTIEVSDSTGKKATATFNVLLSGKITLSPDAGNRGVSITVAGSDFNGNSEITIKFEGTTLNTTPIVVTTTPAGTFTATIKIPVTASTGEQTITATDASGRIGSSIFIVATGGLITLSPDSGLSGTEVTVTGSNFNANTRVTLKFNEITVATTPSIVMTGTDGRFSAKFDVPAGVGIGVHIVIATDDLGKIGHSSFSTESNGELITISPTSASVGSIVTITGNGFAINTDVTIKLDDTALTTNPATVVTTSGGTFTATFTVPSLAAGSHTIAVTVGTKTATASFALTQTGGPSISITPTSGTVGSSITVSGTGFAPSIGITIKLDDNVVASGTTSSSGTFNVLFSIGATVTSGPHTITASDGTKEASNTLSIISGGTNIVNISQMKLVDQSGSSLSTPSIGMHLLIQSDVKNTLSTDQQFTYVVQIKDTDGATIMISWMTGTLPPGRQYAVAQSWLVEDKGEYTAEVFVWETISNPVPLAPMQKTDFSVQ